MFRPCRRADDFVAGVGVPRAAAVEGIAGHEGDGPAVEPGEAGDDAAAEFLAHFEERGMVGDGFDDAAHVVGVAAVARDDGEQEFGARFMVVAAGRGAGRQVPDGAGEIGEETAGGGEGFFFGIHGVVDGAGGELDFPAAEFLLGAGLAELFDHGRAGDEDGGDVLDHH
jgi:hypothetical protein